MEPATITQSSSGLLAAILTIGTILVPILLAVIGWLLRTMLKRQERMEERHHETHQAIFGILREHDRAIAAGLGGERMPSLTAGVMAGMSAPAPGD